MEITKISNGDFKVPAKGLQTGILFQITDLGSHMNDYGKEQRQAFFQFELPEDKLEDGRPLIQGTFITLVLGEKAKLTKLAEALTGDKPIVPFKPRTLLGHACNLDITHETKGDKTNSKIQGYAQLKKSEKVGAAFNPIQIFDLDEFDQKIFDKLPEFLKKQIITSPEYLKATNPTEYAQAKATTSSTGSEDGLDDEIPF